MPEYRLEDVGPQDSLQPNAISQQDEKEELGGSLAMQFRNNEEDEREGGSLLSQPNESDVRTTK